MTTSTLQRNSAGLDPKETLVFKSAQSKTTPRFQLTLGACDDDNLPEPERQPEVLAHSQAPNGLFKVSVNGIVTSQNTPWKTDGLGLVHFLVAGIMGFWLLLSIIRRDRL